MIIHRSADLFNLSYGKKTILVMFPFGGGNTYSYRGLIEHLEKTYDIVCVELPGRNYFMSEPLVANIDRLVEFVLKTWISPCMQNRPYVFYGHSMGALIAYELTKEIVRRNMSAPSHVIASGRAAPSVARKRILHDLPSAQFWDELKRMGGMPESLLQNEELCEYFEPIIRNDFKAVETYRYTSTMPLNIPMTVMSGSNENISKDALDLWKKETTGEIRFLEYSGNHFFLFDHIPEVVSSIEKVVGSTVCI